MQLEKHENKKIKNIYIAVFIFIMLILMSVSFLVGRLSVYIFPPEEQLMINIDLSTKVEDNIREIDLFNTSYLNDSGEVTVESQNGENVVAPGTEGKYIFKIKNTGLRPVDYDIDVFSEIEEKYKDIPVEVRVWKYDGGWISNKAGEWQPLSNSNIASSNDYLNVGREHYYTVYWRWNFDGDDNLDTWFGDEASKEDIPFKVYIETTASESTSPEIDNGTCFPWWIIGLLLIFIGLLIFLILLKRKKEENEDDENENKENN